MEEDRGKGEEEEKGVRREGEEREEDGRTGKKKKEEKRDMERTGWRGSGGEEGVVGEVYGGSTG